MLKKNIKLFLPAFLKKRVESFLKRRHLRAVIDKNPKEVFVYIYKKNIWKDKESVSGPGSNMKQAGKIIEPINDLLKKYKITSMLDVPCGDFN